MAAHDAFGTVFAVDFAGTTTFVAIGDVTNIDVLDIDVDTIDTSSHSSPNQYREFINGMIDGGELSLDLNFDPSATAVTGATNSLKAILGGDKKAMKITLADPGAAEVTFDGLVTGLSAEAPFDDKATATVTIKVTGPVTITP